MLRIAQTVGFHFLRRLMASGDDDDDQHTNPAGLHPFQRLAVGVLALYASLPALAEEAAFLDFLPHLLDALDQETEALLGCSGEAALAPAQATVADLWRCLQAAAATSAGRLRLLHCKGTAHIAALVKAMLLRSPPAPDTTTTTTTTASLAAAAFVLAHVVEPTDTGVRCPAAAMHEALATLATLLPRRDATLLPALEAMASALRSCHAAVAGGHRALQASLASQAWPAQLAQALVHLTRNKLGPELRGLTLGAAAAMCGLQGTAWLAALPAEEGEGQRGAALQLLVQLAHVELRVHLEEEELAAVLQHATVLKAACAILHAAIEHLLHLDPEVEPMAVVEPLLATSKVTGSPALLACAARLRCSRALAELTRWPPAGVGAGRRLWRPACCSSRIWRSKGTALRAPPGRSSSGRWHARRWPSSRLGLAMKEPSWLKNALPH